MAWDPCLPQMDVLPGWRTVAGAAATTAAGPTTRWQSRDDGAGSSRQAVQPKYRRRERTTVVPAWCPPFLSFRCEGTGAIC